jgi:outer membrane protein
VLPPVITLHYRPITTGSFSPCIGAGINGMNFFEGQNRKGFDVAPENGVGYALQAGADIGISGPWSASISVKKVFFNINAEINGGALRSSVDLDPWAISVSVGRKFSSETPGPAPPAGRSEHRLARGQATASSPCALAPLT